MSDLHNDSRRQFLKKSAYIVPLVLTFKAAPALASQGSNQRVKKDCGRIVPQTHHRIVHKPHKRHKSWKI